MKYARPIIKKYWVFEHKKALGLSFLVFAVSYSIGLSFFLIINSFFIPNPFIELAVILILLILASLVVIGSFVNAHAKVVRLMNQKEHIAHSRSVAIFMIFFFVGLLLCLLPLIFYTYPGEMFFLLSIGGILMLLYIAIFLVFDYKYYELAFASILIWAVFVAGVFLVTPIYFSNPPVFNVISLFITSIAIVTVLGISGVVLLQSSADELLKELKITKKLLDNAK
ncbi:MAG: hypothetical protein ACP5HW_02160 [Candidatus Micrarchaeia archaeon]